MNTRNSRKEAKPSLPVSSSALSLAIHSRKTYIMMLVRPKFGAAEILDQFKLTRTDERVNRFRTNSGSVKHAFPAGFPPVT